MSTIEQICCRKKFVSISLIEAELHSVCLILAFNNVKKKDTEEKMLLIFLFLMFLIKNELKCFSHVFDYKSGAKAV